MDAELIREYCLKKKMAEECLPFDEVTPVYKVAGKMFLLLSLDSPVSINVKTDPEKAVELREKYEEVTPGYHMSKKHWNTIDVTGRLNDALIKKWIDDSYDLVVSGLSKKLREQLKQI